MSFPLKLNEKYKRIMHIPALTLLEHIIADLSHNRMTTRIENSHINDHFRIIANGTVYFIKPLTC